MSEEINLRVKRLDPRAVIPTFAHPNEDACFDLRILTKAERTTIWPTETIVFGTGLAFEVPSGYVLKVYVRSSTGIKKGLALPNGTGIIDSGYRGELHIALTNITHEAVTVNNNERVAQGMLCRLIPTRLTEVDELAPSARGENGIGSTGKI